MPTTRTQIPIQDDLFTWPSAQPQLIGGRCAACREWHFPPQANCPACSGRDVERAPLSRRGTLWTWTIQNFVPPTPPYAGDESTFKPFGVGYVELPEGLRVEGRLTESKAVKLRIGMEMELVLEPFRIDAQGREVLNYAFKPVA